MSGAHAVSTCHRPPQSAPFDLREVESLVPYGAEDGVTTATGVRIMSS